MRVRLIAIVVAVLAAAAAFQFAPGANADTTERPNDPSANATDIRNDAGGRDSHASGSTPDVGGSNQSLHKILPPLDESVGGPANLVGTFRTCDSAFLQWGAPSGTVKGYVVYKSRMGGTPSQVTRTKSTEIWVSGAVQHGVDRFEVRAILEIDPGVSVVSAASKIVTPASLDRCP